MSYVPDYGASSYTGDMNMAGSTGNLEPLNLGPNIFLAQPGDLPPEAMNSRVPTVRQLPDKIEKKTLDYLDTLTDEMLYLKPKNCPYTRLELVLRQYRHLSFHTGLLNAQTALSTNAFPVWVSEEDQFINDGILYGRYRHKSIQK